MPRVVFVLILCCVSLMNVVVNLPVEGINSDATFNITLECVCNKTENETNISLQERFDDDSPPQIIIAVPCLEGYGKVGNDCRPDYFHTRKCLCYSRL